MEGKRKRTKVRPTEESTTAASPSSKVVNETSENTSQQQTNSSENENIPEATVIIEEIKSEENVTYKIMDENQGEPGENATIIEMPSVEAEKLVLQENREAHRMEAQQLEADNAISELKIIDETVKEIVSVAEKTVESPELNVNFQRVEEKEGKAVKEQTVEVSLPKVAHKKEEESIKKEVVETPKAKRSRRRASHGHLDEVTSPNPEEMNKTLDAGDASLTRSRYGRVQKTKQPTPGMVSFDVPRRRSSIKNGDKIVAGEPGSELPTELSNIAPPVSSPEALNSPDKLMTGKANSSPKTPKQTKASEPKSSIKIKKLNKTETPRSSTSSNKVPTKKAQKKSIVLKSAEDNAVVYDRETLTVIPEKEGEYMVGDLLWSKLPGYPWWPCMVSVDPVMGIYSKIGGTSYKAERVYHVQYFGTQPLRGYTMPGMIMPFNGRHEYELQLDRVKNSPVAQKSQRSKLLAKYTIKPQFKKEWDLAVDEAEMARSMAPDIRVRELTFEYINDTGSGEKKRKNETPTSSASKKFKKASAPEDVYDFDDTMEDETEETVSPPLLLFSQSRAEKKPDFSVYLKRHRSEAVTEHPHLTDVEIENLLRRKWDLLSSDFKSNYVVRAKMSTTPKSAKKPPKSKSSERSKKASPFVALAPVAEIPTTPPPPPLQAAPPIKNDELSDDEHALVIAEPGEKKKSPRTPSSTGQQKSKPASSKKDKESKSSVLTKKAQKNGIPLSEEVEMKGIEIKSAENAEVLPSISRVVACDSSDETAASEDASSTSEIEATEVAKLPTEVVCAKCHEEATDFIRCTGPCLEAFHPRCINEANKEISYVCPKCASGKFVCYVCGISTEDVKKCCETACGKFYHLACLQKHYPFKMLKPENHEFLCPLHFCLTCYVEHEDDRVFRSVKKRLVKCLKCPTAYHFLDHCIAAGSVTISNSYIICPEHQEEKRGKNDKHLNVTWCFSCNTGGSLVCCERCPAAFHVECLESPPTENSFFCSDCMSRKQLHYGDIVWVKLGCYRWWPGRVCHPKNVPDNIMKLQHSLGDFPVYFFGSHDYFWVHKGRAFLFVEGDSTKTASHGGGNKSLTKSFKLAMQEAIEAYKLWQDAKAAILNYKTSKPPPAVGKCQVVSNTDKSHNRCGCDPNSQYPCSSDVGCFNRLLMLECNSSICSAGDKCCNQRFRKREYVKAVPFKTPNRGWGLKTLQDIKKQQFVIEYVGELIDEEECERRLQKMSTTNDTNFYFLTIDKDTIIDAGPKGNRARFMNHSCSPNCETQKWVVNGVTRVGLFAVQDITAGSELTFNYNLDCRGNEKTVCGCGAQNCSGFIGVRPIKSQGDETLKKLNNGSQKKKPRKRERTSKEQYDSLHDDECFRCGEGGELVMCDRKACPKAFHLDCLNLKEIPRGKWNCPWHHCDDCGKQSTTQCYYCPTSYCSEHVSEEKIKELADGKFRCAEHITEDLAGPIAKDMATKTASEHEPVEEKKLEPVVQEVKDEPKAEDASNVPAVSNGTNEITSDH